MRVKLRQIAYARTGDKGDNLNIGVLPRDEASYNTLRESLTAEVVRRHLSPLVEGPVTRYDLPNLKAFNFLLTKALSGGATQSLRLDFMGRSLAEVLLDMELEV